MEKLKIGLFDVDSKIPNLALMKASAYYKKWNYDVELYSPLVHDSYWLIYASKIFNYPHSNDAYIRSNMILGGPGFYLSEKFKNNNLLFKKLLPEFEHMYPDYSLFNCKYAMGYLTRGCIRKCPFCVVPKMEGSVHKVAELEEFCRDQEKIMLLDNNILAYKNHIVELKKLKELGKKIEFTQGFDIRLITAENARLIVEIPRWKGYRLKFAFDDPNLKKIIGTKLKILNFAGISNGTIEFYVLVGFNTSHEEDLMRINYLKEKGIAVFAMPYNKADPYQMHFSRWINRYFYKYETFEEYLSKKALIAEVITNGR
jgi:hypothetical protein